MDFRILGPLEVSVDGAAVDLGRPKQRALLALLLLQRNTVVTAERLVEELWRGEPVDNPAELLRPHVSRLRGVLAHRPTAGGPVLESRRPGYVLRVAATELDAGRFEKALGDGRAAMAEGRAPAAVQHLTGALGLWRGPALADFSDYAFAQPEMARLEELRLCAVEDLTDARLACGEHRQLAGELEALSAQHPLRERLWSQRMLALYRSGRQADALRAYQEFRGRLGAELGIEPGPELRRLEEAVLLQRPELDWPGLASRPDAGSRRRRVVGGDGSHPPNNLPARLTTFIGRRAERARVSELLGATRLVTLTGAGGCGKTRLAFEVADGFETADGVWAVDLSALSDPSLVDDVLAAVLGIREQPNRPLIDTIADELAESDLLLVMDNCEQVLSACAALSEALLRRCTRLRILATSREPLGVPGELAWRVPSLSLPGTDDGTFDIASSEAVQLFVDRARLAEASFALTEQNATTVAEVCRRLDGVALAIELAAARVGLLSVAEIAGRLDDCFRLLVGVAPTAIPRQQTLDAAVRWSWDLLPSAERSMLSRLSAFSGGFTVEAVEAVCGGDDVPDGSEFELLAQLHRKSLVLRDATAACSRYRLLETIRQFGSLRLEESGHKARTRSRHAAWCTGLARQAEAELTGADQASWLARLESEHDNLRAALEWSAADRDTEYLLTLAGALTLFWRVRGYFNEGREWLRCARADAGTDFPVLRAKALWGEGFLEGMLGNYGSGIAVLTESLALYRDAEDTEGCGRALLLLGNFQQFIGGAALAPLGESIEAARATNDTWCLAHALAICGWVHTNRGELARARALLEECLAVARPENDQQSVALGLYVLGLTALLQGDFPAAARHLEDGLCVYRDLGESYGIAVSLGLLGQLRVWQGEYQGARAHLEQGLALARRMGSPGVIAHCLCQLGRLARGHNDLAAAQARYQEALDATRAANQICRPALAGLGEVLSVLGDEAGGRALVEEALERGRAATDPLDTGQALHHLGSIAHRSGDHGEARSLHTQALRLRSDVGSKQAVADSIDALATTLAASGSLVDAAVLDAAVTTLRTENGYLRLPADRHAQSATVELIELGLDRVELKTARQRGMQLELHDAVALALDNAQERRRLTTRR